MKKDENNIAAIYIRVSTDNQLEFSPDAQLKAIKQYAKTHGYEIDPKYIYKDEGISGRKAEKRPAFMEMIATAKIKPHSPFSKILVHKFDRFARNREDSVVYKSLLKKDCNVDVISITEDFGDDKFSVILEAMLEAMAEYYSLNLSDEVLKGMTEKAHRGEVQTRPPFGYDIKDKQFFINEEEASIVRQIYNDFLNGIGISTICSQLNKMGIKTKRGNIWAVKRLEYVIQNPANKGYTLWTPGNKDTYNFKQRYKNGILKKGTFEPIVSEEIFDKAQEKYKQLKESYKYVKKEQTNDWIRRLVKCSNCGRTLTPGGNGLQCQGYSHRQCLISHFISINKIKKAILNQLKLDFEDPINVNITKIANNKEEDMTIIIKNKLNRIQEKLERCKSLYIEGIDTIEEYKENKKAIEDEKNHLEEQLEFYRANTQKESKKPSTFKIKAKNVYELLIDDSISEDIKYNVVHELIDKVIYYKKDETIEIFYKL